MSADVNAPKYRFCWWCSRQLYGTGARDAWIGDQAIRVHAKCLPLVEAEHKLDLVTCTEECECRKPRKERS